MFTLENIVSVYDDALKTPPFSANQRHPYSLLGLENTRVLFCKGERQEFEVLIAGEKSSFGDIPKCGGIDWGPYHDPQGNEVNALRFFLGNTEENKRLIAHLAYECIRVIEDNPSITNASLLTHLSPYIVLIRSKYLLSPQEQKGLFGELLLLERLLDVCDQKNIPIHQAIESWVAADASNASRDFARSGVVVEVKATSRPERIHYISSIKQLELDIANGESHLFLYSLNVAHDASGGRRLCELVDDLLDRVGGERQLLLGKLQSRGYDYELAGTYRLCDRFSTTGFGSAMFDLSDPEMPCLSESDFQSGRIPPNVSEIKYRLNLNTFSSGTNPVSQESINQHLENMIS